MSDLQISDGERDLLKWLGEEDYSQYGECHGSNLEGLVAKGLAQIHSGGEKQSGFIAQGTSKMYQAVSLTESGRALLRNGTC